MHWAPPSLTRIRSLLVVAVVVACLALHDRWGKLPGVPPVHWLTEMRCEKTTEKREHRIDELQMLEEEDEERYADKHTVSATVCACRNVGRSPPAHQSRLLAPTEERFRYVPRVMNNSRDVRHPRNMSYAYILRCLVTPQRIWSTFRAVSRHAWHVACPLLTP